MTSIKFFYFETSEQTSDLACLLAKEIFFKKINPVRELSLSGINISTALIVALEGNLGAGKTTFAKGFIKSLGVRKRIMSPTFVLMKNYKLPTTNDKRQTTNYKRVYHIDCYRIKNAKELLSLGLKEILNNPENIVLIEWPEKIKKYLPKNIIRVKFEYGKTENERVIRVMNPVRD